MIPEAVQPPLAARIQQPVTAQGLEHMFPVGSLPRTAQSLPPKLIESKLLPQLAKQPAASPLPGPVKLEIAQTHPHPLGQVRSISCFSREELELLNLILVLVENLDRTNPLPLLAVVDLAQIQNRVLHHTTSAAATVLHQ
jgi:hypothetical protein